MNPEIIVALISFSGSVIICLINNYSMNKQTKELIDYKLSELTKQVERHNNVIDRTYKLEEKVTLLEEKLKVSEHRIADLENED